MKRNKKYYAIKLGKGNVKNKIVDNWEECKELVYGCPSIFKGFFTEKEAKAYLNSIDDNDTKEISKRIEKNIKLHKEKKKSTRSISFRVPTDIYNSFIVKIERENLNKDKLLLEVIKELIE